AWISSAGLNQLINLQAEARTLGIRIRVRNLCEVLREVFQLTRLERAFQCEERSGESPLISVR
ncbi:MAG: STAS domain-containing protein, partial [Planctomycetota bacterium]